MNQLRRASSSQSRTAGRGLRGLSKLVGPVLLIVASQSSACSGQENLQSELDAPVPVLSGDTPIDVRQRGFAAPYMYDFDGDGVRDLLVGVSYQNRLRIYRNLGRNDDPRFDGFTLFQDGAFEGRLREFNASGFSPHVVDLNGDGLDDIITGHPFGHVVFFQRISKQQFAKPVLLNGPDSQPIREGDRATVFACDWDADGDLDIVFGNRERVYLITNSGSATKIKLESPERLMSGETPVEPPGGYASPFVIDWDGDAVPDLLTGNGDGSVSLYRNDGTRMRVELERPRTLVPPPQPNDDRGKRARICATDWNGDGKLDLLLGDFGAAFENKLTEDDNARRDAFRAEQARLFDEWSTVYRRYRSLALKKDDDPARSRIRQARLRDLKSTLAGINRRRAKARRDADDIRPGRQYHGRVWLFLRR